MCLEVRTDSHIVKYGQGLLSLVFNHEKSGSFLEENLNFCESVLNPHKLLRGRWIGSSIYMVKIQFSDFLIFQFINSILVELRKMKIWLIPTLTLWIIIRPNLFNIYSIEEQITMSRIQELMICYNWENISKPLVLIGASYIWGSGKTIDHHFYIVWLHWGYGTGYSYRLGWCGFNLRVYVTWWLFLMWVLETPLESRSFGRLLVSPWFGLCGEREMLGSLRINGGCQSCCGISFLGFLALLYRWF